MAAVRGPQRMRLEDFDIQGEIAKGSFGVVYTVIRKSDGRLFALKQVKLEGLSRVEREETIDEARVLAQLNHPHVTKHYDSWIDQDNMLNIVMELAAKGNLSDVIKSYKGKGIPEDMIWRYFIQAILGLNHIHSKKIIHRDIKSLNLFLDSKDNIKIGDLGIARALSDDSNFARTIVGTPYYLSPELCEEKPYNEKSDLWAMGVVLYECAMGHRPFDAQNEGALIRKILRGQYAPVKGQYTPALTQMVTQLLAFKPEQRPDTNALLRNPTLVAKARQLGVDMKPKLSVSSEDKPMYAASQPQQQPPSQGQYNEQYHEGGEAQLQRPSGNTYLKYPPYNNNFSPDAQHPAQQQAPPNRRPPIGGSYANYPPYNNASPSPRPQPGYEAPPPQQGGYQRPASANARTAGQRPGAAAHPFDLPGGRGGGANQQANHPSYPDRREQMATHHAWPADPRTPAVDQRGPMQPYAVHEGANDNYDRMADEIERMALGTADFKRAQAERDAANRANAARGQRDEIRDVMQGGGPNTPSRNQQYRVRPEEMPAAGGRNKLNDGVPFAQHSSGLGTMSMAQQQNAEAWNVNYSPPQYGRKRNNDLMATGPQMRGGDGSGHRPGTANAWAPRAADDATSYMSSHTSYYR